MWAVKYQPKTWDDTSLHCPRVTKVLQSFEHAGDSPSHLLLYGPAGCGKRTRIQIFLSTLFPRTQASQLVQKTYQLLQKTYKYKEKEVNLVLIQSSYHIEVNGAALSELSSKSLPDFCTHLGQSHVQWVVIHHAHLLSFQVQRALLCWMETSKIQFLLCAERITVLDKAFRSRTLPLRLCLPTRVELETMLHDIVQQEQLIQRFPTLSSLIPRWISQACDESQRNITNAVHLLQSSFQQWIHLSKHEHSLTAIPPNGGGERLLNQLGAEFIVTHITSKQPIELLRPTLEHLLDMGVPLPILLRNLITTLHNMLSLDTHKMGQIVECAAVLEHLSKKGFRALFHLQAFLSFVALLLCSSDSCKPIQTV